MRLRSIIVAASILAIQLTALPATADGPYCGTVVEDGSNNPIEGAVVVAVWLALTYWGSPAGPSESFQDAQEVRTDASGHFRIPGISRFSWNPLRRIQDPNFVVFKSGYRVREPGLPDTRIQRNCSWLVELRRIDDAEAKKAIPEAFLPPFTPRTRLPLFMRAVDAEDLRLGRPRRGPLIDR